MGRLRYLAVVGAVMGVVAMPASAEAVWLNTPKHVARLLVTRYRTSDGRRLVAARCAGVRSSAHRFTRAGEAFHRLVCEQVDSVARSFVLAVTVTGPLTVRARAVACSDRHSRFACP